MLKLHILGIAGTFMGGVAALARDLGMSVEGSDLAVYPPMSSQLERLGITLKQGYLPEHISPDCAEVIIGNALSRGNPAVEHVLNAGMAHTSGAQWLAEHVLPGRATLAVAGTHGKTTTTALLAWLLQARGCEAGFLIGGVPGNFAVSARLGQDPVFVVEADEYDTAFFDKRSKFVHYRPRIAILNNLEYDHADIFPDLAAIQRQFHHLVRTVPGNGRLIVNGEDAHLAEVLDLGYWTPLERFGIDGDFDWKARLLAEDGSAFEVIGHGEVLGEVHWSLLGRHNVMNALAAMAACAAAGYEPACALPAFGQFTGIQRRMQHLGEVNGTSVYDDFAHHPTAIAATLAGLRARVGTGGRIVVALEPRSNSMRLGTHAAALAPALAAADAVVFLQRPELPWDAGAVIANVRGQAQAVADVEALLAALDSVVQPGDHVVFMSNGGFDAAPRRYWQRLQAKTS